MQPTDSAHPPNPGISVDTNQRRLDLQTIHQFLTNSYWVRGIPLYAQFGFTPLAAPDRFMERHDPGVYTRSAQPG